MGRYTPALLGGLLIGVLSSLPVVSAGNLCCCLWVVLGGLLTVYLQQQNRPDPIETSEALIGGLLAGIIGAVISGLVGMLMMQFTAGVWQPEMQRALEENPEIPPHVRDFVARLMSSESLGLIMMLFYLPVYSIFAMLGALLGLAFFRKKPPMAPPATPTIPPPSTM
jgi:hypothetical protein